jgi:hypothetical protein
MSRFTQSNLAVRVAFLTAFISVVAAVLPLVALAGGGDIGGV